MIIQRLVTTHIFMRAYIREFGWGINNGEKNSLKKLEKNYVNKIRK